MRSSWERSRPALAFDKPLKYGSQLDFSFSRASLSALVADQVGGPGQKQRVDPHKWEKREALLVIPKWSPGAIGELPPIARVLKQNYSKISQ